MDILMLLPTFVIALLLSAGVVIAMYLLRLGKEVYNLKVQVSMLKVEFAKQGDGRSSMVDRLNAPRVGRSAGQSVTLSQAS